MPEAMTESECTNSSRPLESNQDQDIDVNLLRFSLAMTPWERMQANDDALNFGDTLRAAMQERCAESE
jgi:hypothetical protein